MRKFHVYVTNDDIHMRRIDIKANTINGVLKKSKKVMKNLGYNYIYEITTRVGNCSLCQPVFDFFNGNISNYYGLNL